MPLLPDDDVDLGHGQLDLLNLALDQSNDCSELAQCIIRARYTTTHLRRIRCHARSPWPGR